MSWLSSLFKPKSTTVTQEPLQPGFQQDIGSQLAQWIKTNLPNYTPGQPYTGQLSASMSGPEQTGLSQLTPWLAAPPTGPTFQAGNQQILDTLGGKYADPNQSPFIQSMIAMAKQNTGDQINQSRASAGSRGSYFNTASLRNEGLIRERTQNQLQTVIGDWLNQERNRQFNAIPYAQQFDQYGNLAAPLAKITASQTLGSLERTLTQGDLERKYQEFVRQRGELSQIPGQAQSFYGTNVPYGNKSASVQNPSAISQLSPLLASMFGSNNSSGGGIPNPGTPQGMNLQSMINSGQAQSPAATPTSGSGGGFNFSQLIPILLQVLSMAA